MSFSMKILSGKKANTNKQNDGFIYPLTFRDPAILQYHI